MNFENNTNDNKTNKRSFNKVNFTYGSQKSLVVFALDKTKLSLNRVGLFSSQLQWPDNHDEENEG